MDHDTARARFRLLHESGTFTMPNAYDEGSARLLADLGFEAVATTSSGHAATLGRRDMTVTRDELVAHAAALARATALPLSVDAEQCFPDEAGGVAGTVERLAEAGAAGCSIEDWDPRAARIEPLEVATARVAEAAPAASAAGMVLTARAENLLRGVDDLDDTIARLGAYRDAGAGCVYAPGLVDADAIRRVVVEVGAPLNVLLLRGGPSRDALAGIGVRRLSVGGWLAFVAYGAMVRAATHLRDEGTLDETAVVVGRDVVARAFATSPST
ncbi:MAG TPA: isocitrate lyase/phosphoenolpyruvate mutase family protein [Acidimicrobiales bacterium]|nr:isocitrate lyase/phosphoenolpyruvate mutase family protein [Acidimicrobiales bacterium]